MFKKFVQLSFGVLLLISLPAFAKIADNWQEPTLADNEPLMVFYAASQHPIIYLAEHHRGRFEDLTPEQKERLRQRREKFKSLPPEERERIKKAREKFKKASPEERGKLREKWQKMTPEERNKHRKKMKNKK